MYTMQNIMKNKVVLIGGAVVLIVFVLAGVFLLSQRGGKTTTVTKGIAPTEEVIPTVDSSVRVELSYSIPGKEALLSISAIPNGTTSMDYELSYLTAKQGLQGVIGTITTDNGSSYEKKLTLGTCSSGTCVYHDVVGKIRVTIKFNGNYGEKLFEKEYEL